MTFSEDTSTVVIYGSNTSSTGANVTVAAPQNVKLDSPEKNIDKAVFAHVSAMRALGTTRTNSLEIAEALNLPESVVVRALKRMTDKGIKLKKK